MDEHDAADRRRPRHGRPQHGAGARAQVGERARLDAGVAGNGVEHRVDAVAVAGSRTTA